MNTEKIRFEMDTTVTAEQLAILFKNSGIRRPFDDLARLQKMIDNADLTITAWVEDKLVGIARSVTDWSYCCYLSDLAVDKEYQKGGIGKALIQLTQEKIGDEVALLLLASPIAMDYYPHIGFDKVENGYIIPRKK
ncbi:GNAT family N-acetyltransferase [Bacillus sp. PS06]|uniref:GNAT family N-acetyltransferase n=1 Tax=Bacillus sp. PS06 TaxID=2764176 RepID=UPI0017845B6A|nr:GNAT family N-acetyltransferase [Bacillus sp. PS06]MBD8068163.1 GNAT family N-acetyltransferase [Bacillus sp. PS06]